MTPVNVALCSFGMSGRLFHAPFINVNPKFNLYAVWERSKNLAGEKYAGIKTYRSLEAMMADESVELVIVNTPNYSHFEYVKKALEAGKHVAVEKPFTVTVDEGEKLIEIAGKQNKILSVYHNRRYDSDYKTIRKVVEEKMLGELVEVEMHFDRYKEELSPKIHKETPGPGRGIFYDLGSHLIDQALQLFGMPDNIFADIEIMRPISLVDDYFELLLFYKKLRVRIKGSYVVREALPGYALHGLNGSFIKPKTDVQENMLLAGIVPGNIDWGTEPESERGLLHTEKNGEIIKEYLTSEQGNYGEFYDGMYDSIRNNKPVQITGEDGLKVIKIIEAGHQSSQSRCMITL